MDEREMVSADEARAMEHRSDGCDEAADVMHMERSALRYVRTVIALHAIIEGRTTAPSFEEDNAARRAGLYPIKLAGRWHLYDNDGRMRAWPVTENGVRDGR